MSLASFLGALGIAGLVVQNADGLQTKSGVVPDLYTKIMAYATVASVAGYTLGTFSEGTFSQRSNALFASGIAVGLGWEFHKELLMSFIDDEKLRELDETFDDLTEK